jgi:hypothetical protein
MLISNIILKIKTLYNDVWSGNVSIESETRKTWEFRAVIRIEFDLSCV